MKTLGQTLVDRIGRFLGSSAMHGTLLFFAGLGLTIREAVLSGQERPSLYVLFAGMMGLPLVWGKGSSGSDDD